jgi:cardiolipin synthase (CMP-forming)
MTPASFVTLFRLVLIPFFLMAVTYGHPRAALWIFVLSGVSDGLDGIVARYFGQRSVLGSILDPMADKLVLTAAYIALALPTAGLRHPLPAWLPFLTISRDVFIVLISLVLNMTLDVKKFPPSWPGKFTTFFQITLALAVLLQNAYELPAALVAGLLWTVVALTIFSGLHYLWRIRHQTREAG